MILLDSNIIIYASEPDYDLVRKFIADNNSVVSVITKVEVLDYHRLTLETLPNLELLFRALPILPISDDIIDQAIILRQKRKMSLGDALIAATGLIHKVKLATANVKDYVWIDDLEVINPLIDG